MPKFLLTLLSFLLIALFIKLGFWQLSRAHEKIQLLARYQQSEHTPIKSLTDVAKHPRVWEFHGVELTGHFDNDHLIFIDNQFFNHQLGYQVVVPFVMKIGPVLFVNRGWVPMGQNYQQLPAIPPVTGEVTIRGRVMLPQHNPLIRTDFMKINRTWPLRVEEFSIPMISNILGETTYPFLVTCFPDSPHAFKVQFVLTNISPERHRAYAFQWFAMAVTLIMITIILWMRRRVPT